MHNMGAFMITKNLKTYALGENFEKIKRIVIFFVFGKNCFLKINEIVFITSRLYNEEYITTSHIWMEIH